MSGDGIFKLNFLDELFCCRGKKIFAGLQEGATAFPASPYLIPITVALIKVTSQKIVLLYISGNSEWQFN